MRKSFAVLIFLLSLVWCFVVYAASVDKPDLIFDKTRTNISKTATQTTTYNLQYFVQNIWKWMVFKSSKTYFIVRCKDKNGKVVKERQYKWKMNDIRIEKFVVKESVLPVSCNLDVENKIPETNEKNNFFVFKSVDSPIQDPNPTDITKRDLTIKSIWLNRNFPSPKVWDEKFYITAVIKNLWKSISFSKDTKWVLYCSSAKGRLLNYEIKNWILKNNGTLNLNLIANEDNFLIPFTSVQDDYTVNCSIQLSSKVAHEDNDKNNYKNFKFDVNPTSGDPILPSTWNQSSFNGFDLIIQRMSTNGENPSLYKDNFSVQSTIKNIGNMNFNWDITFICEDYTEAIWQTIIFNRLPNQSIKAWESATFINSGLISNFYNKSYSKTMSCVAWVKNDINIKNNSYSFSFDLLEKNSWLADLGLSVLEINRVSKKIVLMIKNVWNNQISLSEFARVSCVLYKDWIDWNILAFDNVFHSYQGNKNVLAVGESYTATIDLSQYAWNDIDVVTCSSMEDPSFPEASKTNNIVTFSYKND